MAAQGSRATALDGGHDALVFQRQRVLLPVSGAVLAKDVGDFVGWPGVGRGRVQDRAHGGTSANEGRWDRSRRSSGLRVRSRVLRVTCRYQAVEVMDEWPIRTWMVRRSTPASRRWVAKQWRSTWMLPPLRMPAWALAWLKTTRALS